MLYGETPVLKFGSEPMPDRKRLGLDMRAAPLPRYFVLERILPKQLIKNYLGIVAYSRVQLHIKTPIFM